MTRATTSRRRRALAVVCIVLLATPAALGGAAAQTDSDVEDGPLDSVYSWAEGTVSSVVQSAGGFVDRLTYGAAHAVGLGSEDTASDTVDELRDYADDGSREEAIIDYANVHLPDDVTLSDYDVLRLDLEAGDESRTIYAVANVSDGNVTDLAIENTTSKSVDYTLEFDEFATRELPEDVEWVYSNYVEPGEAPDGGAQARFATKYPGHVNISEGDA